MTSLLSLPEKYLTKLVESKLFDNIAKRPLVATAVLSFIVFFWSFPSYDVALVKHEMDGTWEPIFTQIDAPFTNHVYEPNSHAEKLAFRFVPAVILGALNIHSMVGAFIFQAFTMVLFYFLLLKVFDQLLNDKKKALLFSLPFCFVITGTVYMSDYRGIFDTLALDFILMAILARRHWIVVLPLLLAYYTDERAFIVSPAIFLLNAFEQHKFDSFNALVKAILLPSNMFIIASWVLYLVIRFTLSATIGLQTGTGGVNLFMDQISKTGYTLYVGLEGFLIGFILLVMAWWRKKLFAFATCFVLVYLVLFVVAQSVFDINRSMAYALPIIVLMMYGLNKLYASSMVKIIALTLVVNLIYFDSYPLLLQLYRMHFITHTL